MKSSFKSRICICLHYLCVILKFVDDLNLLSVTHMQKKNKKTGRGKNLFTAQYIDLYLNFFLFLFFSFRYVPVSNHLLSESPDLFVRDHILFSHVVHLPSPRLPLHGPFSLPPGHRQRLCWSCCPLFLFDSLFPLVHTHIVNPGMAGSISEDSSNANQLGDCLRMTRQDVNPFGPHPKAMADTLASALRAGRVLSLALGVGLEVMNITDTAELSKECSRALVRMHYCSHCRGLTLIRACSGYCLNVMRGCLASLSELPQPLETVRHSAAGSHAHCHRSAQPGARLAGIRGQVEEAILYAQLHGPRLTATVGVSIHS